MRDQQRRSCTRRPGFLLPFRLPALASWVILRPLGSWTFLTVGLPDTGRAGPHRGCHVAHAQDATGQGAPLTPGTVVRSRLTITLQPAPAASQRPVPTAPLAHSIGGGHRHEASTGVHLRSPIPPGGHAATRRREALPRSPAVFSLPVAPGWNGSPWASSSSFAPRSHPRRTSRRRQAIAHWPGYYTLDISRTSIGASHLHSCTLMSHVHPGRLHRHLRHTLGDQPADHLAQHRVERLVLAQLLVPLAWLDAGCADRHRHDLLAHIDRGDPRVHD